MHESSSRAPQFGKILVAALVAVLALGSLLPPAAADWSASANLASPGDRVAYASVHYDGSGRGYLFFLKYLGGPTWQVNMRQRPAGGGPWGPIAPLSLSPTPGPNGLDVAVNSAGDIVLAYNAGGQIEVTRRPAGGVWAPVVGYNSPGTSGPNSGFGLIPQVDVGDDGTAIVAWAAYNSCCGNVSRWRVLGSAYRPDSGWDATPQVWNASTSDVHSQPAVTIEANGNGVVAFGARTGFDRDELFTVDFTTGAWAAPALRSSAGIGSNNYLDADSRGTTSAIVWSRGTWINVISRVDGVWSSASTLTTNQNGDAPSVAVGEPGTVYAAYTEQGGNAGVYFANTASGGGFNTQRLSSGFGPSVAANALGDLAVAWDDYVAPNRYAFMMLKPAGGSFPVSRSQLTTAASDNSTMPRVAVDLWGHVLAAATPISQGFGTAITSAIETRDAATAPATTQPSIAPAVAHVGDVLTCSPGTFGGTPPFSHGFQWQKNGVAVAGEAAPAYVVRTGDVGEAVSCLVTATNDAGAAQATSDERFIDYTAPLNLTRPTLSGTAEAGQTLTCNPGTWSGNPTPDLTFEWMRNGSAVPSEVADTYVVALSDQGTTLACRVTATNPGGVDVSASTAVTIPAVVNPTNSVAPSIAGPLRAAIGDEVTCRPGTWAGQPTPTLTFFWLRDGATVAYGNKYTATGGDAGTTLTCEVTGENVGGELTVASSNNRVLDPVPVNNTLPVVNKAVGSTWAVNGIASCAKGSWTFAQTYTYTWQRDGSPISSATASTYQLTAADAGHGISCGVTGTGRMGSTVATSAPKPLAAPPMATVDPSITGTARPTRTLTCARGTWTNATSFAYSWQRNGLPVGGTTNKYIVQTADVGATITCAVQASGPGGSTVAWSAGRVVTP